MTVHFTHVGQINTDS